MYVLNLSELHHPINPWPNSNFVWDFALSKLYTNALISTLNARAGWGNLTDRGYGPNVLFGDETRSPQVRLDLYYLPWIALMATVSVIQHIEFPNGAKRGLSSFFHHPPVIIYVPLPRYPLDLTSWAPTQTLVVSRTFKTLSMVGSRSRKRLRRFAILLSSRHSEVEQVLFFIFLKEGIFIQ